MQYRYSINKSHMNEVQNSHIYTVKRDFVTGYQPIGKESLPDWKIREKALKKVYAF